MIKRKGLVILTLAIFLFAVALVYAQQKPQDVYKLQMEGAKFPPVDFNHKNHFETYKIDCKVCHHTDANPAEKATQCMTCHDPAGEKGLKAMDAYHNMCINCHKKENEAGKNAPTKCNDCHKKA